MYSNKARQHTPLPRRHFLLAFVADRGSREGEVVVLLGDYISPEGSEKYPACHYLSGEAAKYLPTIPIRAFASDG